MHQLKRFFRNEDLWLSIVLTVLIASQFASLLCFGIIDPSEGFYSEAAREMIERDDYFTPCLNYQPFYEKPIGIYWLIICSYKVFGINEFAARFPSALSALLCALFIAHILVQVHLKRVVLLSAVVLMTTPLFAVVARLSLTDMPLTSCLTIALLSLWYFSLNNGHRGYLYTAYVMIGFAVLLKGPLAALLCGSTFLVKLLNQPVTRALDAVSLPLRPSSLIRVLKPFSIIPGVMLILMISLPWYLFEIIHTHGEFYQEFFLRQHFSRLEGLLSHHEPWYFYLVVFVVGTLPWSVFLCCIPNLLRQICERQILKSSDRIRADLLHFCVIWVVVTIMLFSLSAAKLATYIVSTTVPTSIILAISMDHLVNFKDRRSIIRLACVAIFLTIATILVFAVCTHFRCDADDALTIVLTLSIAPAFTFVAKHLHSERKMLYLIVSGMALTLTLTLAAALHTYDEVRNRSLRRMYLTAAVQQCSLASFLRFLPGSLFYFKRPITNLKTTEDFSRFLQNTPAPHFVIAEKSVSRLLEVVCAGLKPVQEQGDYSLMKFIGDSDRR